MKKIVSMLLVLALLLSTATVGAFANQGNGNNGDKEKGNAQGQGQYKEFKDTNGHWGNQAITDLQSSGILQGYEDGTFRPDETLTQDQLAVILDLLLETITAEDSDTDDEEELTEEEEEALEDVPSWARESVRQGLKNGYMNMGRYHSATQCNRLTAFVQLAIALGLEPVTDYEENPFTDWGLMSEEDYGYILALYEEGYISGYPDGSFNPNAMVNRAQIAVIIDKILDDETAIDEDSEDTTQPTWPEESVVETSAITSESLTLTWSAAEDDVAVTLYKVSYEQDEEDIVKYIASGKSLNVKELEAETEYTFTVEARDAAGNWSDDGPSVTATTEEETSEEDTTAPTWESDAELTVTTGSATSVTLSWPDAEDDVAVNEYKLYVNGKLTEVLDADENEVTLSGLKADTEYKFLLKARDEAGNFSKALSLTYVTAEE